MIAAIITAEQARGFPGKEVFACRNIPDDQLLEMGK